MRRGRSLSDAPDHGAVEGAGGAGQHRGMSQETSRERIHAMQNEAQKTPTSPAFGRSSIKRLPAELREAVDQAIADGATIDEITARIRAEGETCSRSAVGRYAKTMRDLIREQQETDRTIQAWVRELGERPEGQAGLILIETLRTMALATMAHLSAREEPVSTQELARLALTLKRIEGTDKLRADRKQAAEKAARAGGPKRRGGLSPETVAVIRAEVEGRPPPPPRTVTSAPVDPWARAESQPSSSIPDCHQGHGLRGAVRPTEQESREAHRAFHARGSARCGASGQGRDALCGADGAALRVAPGRDAGRDPGETCRFIPPDPGDSRPEIDPTASQQIARPAYPCPPPL